MIDIAFPLKPPLETGIKKYRQKITELDFQPVNFECLLALLFDDVTHRPFVAVLFGDI
jgi:hypothetical protein